MKTVLIIEDNLTHMALAATLLKKSGYAVLKASDAETGIRLAREQHPDLILMDIHLPGMDGLTAIFQLKSDPATQHIPVILQTSFFLEHPEQEVRAAGAAGFIAKPFHYKEYLATIEAILHPENQPHKQ